MPEKAPLARRFLALFIDIVPIVLLVLAVGLVPGSTQSLFASDASSRTASLEVRRAFFDWPFLAYVIYAMMLEVSPLGATFGKLVVGIRPVDANGQTFTGGRAFMRNLAKWASILLLGTPYLWALFDKRNRTAHDLMVGAYVAVNTRSEAEARR
jgi:uncharacterized RDD family membrane protein YckC